MRKHTLLLLIAIGFAFTACQKKDDLVFHAPFDDESELSSWVKSASGTATIDSGYLRMASTTGCFRMETTEGIPLKSGASYRLSFKAKVIAPQAGDQGGGCAGYYLLLIRQGDEDLIYKGIMESSGWIDYSEIFESKSNASAQIALLVGTQRGAWMDDLSLIRE